MAFLAWLIAGFALAGAGFHIFGVADMANQAMQPERVLIALVAGCVATVGWASVARIGRR